MIAPKLRTWMLAAAATAPLAGCLSPNDPVPTRWFTPAVPTATETTADVSTPVVIARVGAAAHLGKAMVWRRSDVEIALDETNRWVDDPAVLVERSLERALFGSGRLSEGSRDAARVEAFVAAFEAVLYQPPVAVIRLELLIRRPDGSTVARTTLKKKQSLTSTEPEDVARALGAVLGEVTADAAGWCAEAAAGS